MLKPAQNQGEQREQAPGEGGGPAGQTAEEVGPWSGQKRPAVARVTGGRAGRVPVEANALPPVQITGWQRAARLGGRRSRWRLAASASPSAGRPPRRAQARPPHPGPSTRGGGRAAARAQPDSPACAPPTARRRASRSCARLPRKEAPPREPGGTVHHHPPTPLLSGRHTCWTRRTLLKK